MKPDWRFPDILLLAGSDFFMCWSHGCPNRQRSMGCYRCWMSQGGDMAPTCLSQASHLGMQALCVRSSRDSLPEVLGPGGGGRDKSVV